MMTDIKWAETLLHHAAHPDPVSCYCAIPASEIEGAANAMRERDDEIARLRAVEAKWNSLTAVREIEAENLALRTENTALAERVGELEAEIRHLDEQDAGESV